MGNPAPDLHTAPEGAWREALRREELIRPLALCTSLTGAQIDDASSKLGLGKDPHLRPHRALSDEVRHEFLAWNRPRVGQRTIEVFVTRRFRLFDASFRHVASAGQRQNGRSARIPLI